MLRLHLVVKATPLAWLWPILNGLICRVGRATGCGVGWQLGCCCEAATESVKAYISVSKRITAPYRSGPSRDRIKVKNSDGPAMLRVRAGMW
jgi:hypothetical protein